MKIRYLTMSFILISIIAGCSNRTSDNMPPKIIAGQDTCDNCFMLINEIKYASTVRLKDGEAKRFDDIRCMLSYSAKNKKEIKYYWVYDFNSKKPFPADKSFFVKTKNVVTPMGGGILAFGKKQEAENFAKKEKALVMNFNDLIKLK